MDLNRDNILAQPAQSAQPVTGWAMLHRSQNADPPTVNHPSFLKREMGKRRLLRVMCNQPCQALVRLVPRGPLPDGKKGMWLSTRQKERHQPSVRGPLASIIPLRPAENPGIFWGTVFVKVSNLHRATEARYDLCSTCLMITMW